MAFLGSLFSGGSNPEGANQNEYNQALSNSQSGLKQQQNLMNALASQNGISNQSQVYNQLQQIAQGQGPNPATALLNQQTGQNVAQQGSLMASQRGANTNPGLIAREAAQQGANLQQQAVGQAASTQAQQSLGAIGQSGELANQEVAQQQNQQNAYSQNANSILNTETGSLNNKNEINQKNYDTNTGLASSLVQSAGSLLATLNKGGLVHPEHAKVFALWNGGISKEGGNVPGKAQVIGNSPKNDVVEAMLSPGEIVLPRTVTMSDNAPQKAKDFVEHLAKRHNRKDKLDFHEALKRAMRK